MLLTLDLGTSATKAALWDGTELLTVARAPVPTHRPHPGWAEQDPNDWWAAAVSACRAIGAPQRMAAVQAVCFAAARETFVPATAAGEPLGPALVWSDRRATAESAELVGRDPGGADGWRRRTGTVIGPGSTVTKVLWLARHRPADWDRAAWILAPRDVLVARMTGEVVTDATLASRTGFYDTALRPVAEVDDVAGGRLPPVTEPSSIAGGLAAAPANELGLAAGTPVVVGAGDRACEVLGTAASATEPMVSWGTTANLSVPTSTLPGRWPRAVAVSRGARGGHLLEAGLSASGEALEWLANVAGCTSGELAAEAAAAAPGAAMCLPWLNGARAPWWAPGATASFWGLTTATTRGDLARALYEGVAFDLAAALDATIGATLGPSKFRPAALRLTGGGGASELWAEILSAVTALPVRHFSTVEAASAGACSIALAALGTPVGPDEINPVTRTGEPGAALVEDYRVLRAAHHHAASRALEPGGLTELG